ncbi:hypothetical protein HY498_01400 [Candidatus Woesearchaeota archaeon]|nr:hypothetical protein [Candidatus Woesearchaeota archaeon]
MCKIIVVGKESGSVNYIKNYFKRNGFEIVKKNPEFVISVGGDGSYFYAERLYPGIPKILVRYTSKCYLCENLGIDKIVKNIKSGKFKIVKDNKLVALFKGKNLIAVNDVCIRNVNPIYAIRFSLFINGKLKYKEIIGDGVVIATTFGSSGYFKSITGNTFKNGFGVAFNNPTIKLKPLFLKNKDNVKVKIFRGDAHLSVDNYPKIFNVGKNENVLIKVHKESAKLVRLK